MRLLIALVLFLAVPATDAFATRAKRVDRWCAQHVDQVSCEAQQQCWWSVTLGCHKASGHGDRHP